MYYNLWARAHPPCSTDFMVPNRAAPDSVFPNPAGTGFGRISKSKIRPEPESEPDSSPIKFRCSLAVTGCKKAYVIVNPNLTAYLFTNFITLTFSGKLIIKDSLLLRIVGYNK